MAACELASCRAQHRSNNVANEQFGQGQHSNKQAELEVSKIEGSRSKRREASADQRTAPRRGQGKGSRIERSTAARRGRRIAAVGRIMSSYLCKKEGYLLPLRHLANMWLPIGSLLQMLLRLARVILRETG